MAERKGRIRFESEEEQHQTNALAGRMLEQAALGHTFVGKTIARFKNENVGTNDSLAEIELSDGSKIKFSGFFRIESNDKEFMNALAAENEKQGAHITPAPERAWGERLMSREGPILDEQGDPETTKET